MTPEELAGLDHVARVVQQEHAKREQMQEAIAAVLVSVTDFYPGDVEDCAYAIVQSGLLAEVWDEGYGAAEDFEHGHGVTINPWPNPEVDPVD